MIRNDAPLTRRAFLQTCVALLGVPALIRPQLPSSDPGRPAEVWVCPMDPDVRSSQAGVCPRCGMKLLQHVPEAVEYRLEVTQSPQGARPGQRVTFVIRVLDPVSGQPVHHFELVHEKLMHLFVVSENLEFFAHEHPDPQPDGSFRQSLQLPLGGMYRMLADFYPSGSVPQLLPKTIFVVGKSAPAELVPSFAPAKSQNLTAALALEPAQPLAGLTTRMFFTVDPAAGLEPYLGAWGHLLAVSDDLVDFLHLHPFLADGGPVIQFNVIFPRPRLYRLWVQFQRHGVVNTGVFTVAAKAL